MQKPEEVSLQQTCALCNAQTFYTSCDNCQKAFYCSLQHLNEHKEIHQLTCIPYEIKQKTNKENRTHLVACRDLKPGEILMEDFPVVFGPLVSPKFHVCTSCGLELTSDLLNKVTLCSMCNLPVCGPFCEQDPIHANNECKVFRTIHKYNDENDLPFLSNVDDTSVQFRQQLLMYTLMIRGAALQNSEDQRYLDLLENTFTRHSSIDKSTRAKNTFEANRLHSAFLYFASPMKLAFPKEFYTNAYHIYCTQALTYNEVLEESYSLSRFTTDKCDYKMEYNTTNLVRRFFVVYPKLSGITYSCIANCSWSVCPEQKYKIRVRTTVSIKQDELLTICFNPIMRNIELGTFERQTILQNKYGIQCTCKRCEPPSDFGIFSSGISCNPSTNGGINEDKKFGYLLPRNPFNLSPKSEWKCSACESCRRHHDVLETISRFRKKLNDKLANADLQYFLERCSSLRSIIGNSLHPNHGLIVETTDIIQMKFEQACMKEPSYVTWSNWVLYIRWLKYILSIRDIVCPGFSMPRARLLYQLSCALNMKIKAGFFLGKKELTNDYIFFMQTSKEAFEYYMNAFYLPGENFNVFGTNLFDSMKFIQDKWEKELLLIEDSELTDFLECLKSACTEERLKTVLEDRTFVFGLFT